MNLPISHVPCSVGQRSLGDEVIFQDFYIQEVLGQPFFPRYIYAQHRKLKYGHSYKRRV